jgi:hypothetical protein
MSNESHSTGWTDRLPVIGSLSFPFILSLFVACLLVVSAISGLLFGQRGVYAANPATLPTFLTQDVITLLVGVPLLIASIWTARHGSVRGLLLWMGTLFYFAYVYSYTVLGTWLAPLYLMYVAIISMSVYSLIYILVSADADAVKARFSSRTPLRWAGGFLMAISVLLGTMWVIKIVGYTLSGTAPTPQEFVIFPLDLIIAFPALFWGGLWLWRRQPLGYVVGGIVLLKSAAEGLTLVAQTAATLVMSGIGDALLPAYALVGFGGLALLIVYLHGVQVAPRVGRARTLQASAPARV